MQLFSDDKECNVESLGIPRILLGEFCVVGVSHQCANAICYTHKQLTNHKRVQSLVLLYPSLLELEQHYALLADIHNHRCAVYSYICSGKVQLEKYQRLAQTSLVMILKNG